MKGDLLRRGALGGPCLVWDNQGMAAFSLTHLHVGHHTVFELPPGDPLVRLHTTIIAIIGSSSRNLSKVLNLASGGGTTKYPQKSKLHS